MMNNWMRSEITCFLFCFLAEVLFPLEECWHDNDSLSLPIFFQALDEITAQQNNQNKIRYFATHLIFHRF